MIKRIFLFLLATIMVFSLAACGGNTDNNSTPTGSSGSSTTTPPASQGEDNTPSEPSDNGDTDKEWPDSEWTKQVPKPPFKVSSYSEYGQDAYINLADMTYDTTKAYVEQLKSSGFEDYGSSTDNGKELAFVGKNADGWKVTVTSTGSMIITKPE